MTLYITDRFSFLRCIAYYIAPKGELHFEKNYILTQNGIVAWCPRDFLLMYSPEEYDEKYKVWDRALLPIVPQEWKMKINPYYKAYFIELAAFIKAADVVVHAGSLSREGQCAIDELLEYVGYKGKVLRMQRLAPLNELVDNTQYRPITLSAKARKYTDWLFGVNFSRACSILTKTHVAVGRIKIVVLAMVIRREKEIQAKRQACVRMTLAFSNGKKVQGKLLASFDEKVQAEAFVSAIQAISSEKVQIKKVEILKQFFTEPYLCSCSDIQIAAGKLYDFSLLLTTNTLKSLAAKKLISFPFTSGHFIPKKYYAMRNALLDSLAQYSPLVAQWISQCDRNSKSRLWQDQFGPYAILPTSLRVSKVALSDVERKIYELIMKSYIAQFYSPALWVQQRITCVHESREFTVEAEVCRHAGFEALYLLPEETDFEVEEKNVLHGITAQFDIQPKHFTEWSLLKAMGDVRPYFKEPAKAGKEAVSLGRRQASVIQQLIDKRMLHKNAGYLFPTVAAKNLVAMLPEEITYPDESAEWEEGLQAIECGASDVTLETFWTGFALRLKELMKEKVLA